MPPRLLSPLNGNLNDNLNYNVERRPGDDEAHFEPTPTEFIQRKIVINKPVEFEFKMISCIK